MFPGGDPESVAYDSDGLFLLPELLALPGHSGVSAGRWTADHYAAEVVPRIGTRFNERAHFLLPLPGETLRFEPWVEGGHSASAVWSDASGVTRFVFALPDDPSIDATRR